MSDSVIITGGGGAGSVTIESVVVSGSFLSASYATTSQTSSYTLLAESLVGGVGSGSIATASYALVAESVVGGVGSGSSETSSFAETASFISSIGWYESSKENQGTIYVSTSGSADNYGDTIDNATTILNAVQYAQVLLNKANYGASGGAISITLAPGDYSAVQAPIVMITTNPKSTPSWAYVAFNGDTSNPQSYIMPKMTILDSGVFFNGVTIRSGLEISTYSQVELRDCRIIGDNPAGFNYLLSCSRHSYVAIQSIVQSAFVIDLTGAASYPIGMFSANQYGEINVSTNLTITNGSGVTFPNFASATGYSKIAFANSTFSNSGATISTPGSANYYSQIFGQAISGYPTGYSSANNSIVSGI